MNFSFWNARTFRFADYTFAACSEETEITLPSKGEEEVKEIVSALEENDEISDFVEVLKTVNVADLEEDELTVFAVRNSSAAMSRSAALDSTSVKRHTAKHYTYSII